MPPKKRTTKKGKNLTKKVGVAKQPQEEDTETLPIVETSETDETGASEQYVNSEEKVNTDPPPMSPSTSDEEESGEDLPNLIEELLNKDGDCNITYVTSSVENRAFELDARRELLQMHFDLENLKNTFDASLRLMRNLCPDVKKGKVFEAVKSLGHPMTFKDLILKLASLPSPGSQVPHVDNVTSNFDESENELDKTTDVTPNDATLQFPSAANMLKYQTPQNIGHSSKLFQFGTQTKGLSTNKPARLPKPGEIVYSESGSPILQRRIPENHQTLERVEILQPDGTKYEVDMVYRGAQDVKILQGFKEFAKDVRGIAASRSTPARQNRVQPPRIITAGPSATPKGKKPDWR